MNEQQAKIVEVIQVTTPCPPNTMGLDQVEYYTKEGRSIGHEMPPASPSGATNYSEDEKHTLFILRGFA